MTGTPPRAPTPAELELMQQRLLMHALPFESHAWNVDATPADTADFVNGDGGNVVLVVPTDMQRADVGVRFTIYPDAENKRRGMPLVPGVPMIFPFRGFRLELADAGSLAGGEQFTVLIGAGLVFPQPPQVAHGRASADLSAGSAVAAAGERVPLGTTPSGKLATVDGEVGTSFAEAVAVPGGAVPVVLSAIGGTIDAGDIIYSLAVDVTGAVSVRLQSAAGAGAGVEITVGGANMRTFEFPHGIAATDLQLVSTGAATNVELMGSKTSTTHKELL